MVRKQKSVSPHSKMKLEADVLQQQKTTPASTAVSYEQETEAATHQNATTEKPFCSLIFNSDATFGAEMGLYCLKSIVC